MADAMCRYRRLRGRPRVLPHRHRRARRADRPGGRAGGHLAAGATPTRSRRRSARRGGASASPTTTSSAPPSPGTRRWCRRSCSVSGTRARSTSASTAATTASAASASTPRRRSWTASVPITRRALTFIKEKNYFFRMSKYQDWLIKHLEENPDFIQPERYRNEVLGFLREPLQDLSISRPRSRLDVGHPAALRRPVRDLRLVRRADQLRLGASAIRTTRASRRSGRARQHLIGKDILKPHGVYWPTMLKAAGLPLYRRLNVHGYWSLGGSKMSKSVGNVVEALHAHRQVRPRRLPLLPPARDELRPRRRLQRGGAGRAAQRRPRQRPRQPGEPRDHADRRRGRRRQVPAAGRDAGRRGDPRRRSAEARARSTPAMEEFAFQKALAAIWEFIGAVNRYVDASAPWALAKDPAQRARASTACCTRSRESLALPRHRARSVPAGGGRARSARRARPATLGRRPAAADGSPTWTGACARAARRGRSKAVRPLPAGRDEGRRRPRRRRRRGRPDAGEGRGGRAHPHRRLRRRSTCASPRCSRPSRCRSRRSCSSSRSAWARRRARWSRAWPSTTSPAALVGRKVVVVANLEPATLMGVESNGMVLAASHEGTLSLLTLDRDLPSGAKVK